MTEIFLDALGPAVEELVLVPASGGLFELEVDGELVFSKKALGRHITPEELADLIAEFT